jgi:hypothetical protein
MAQMEVEENPKTRVTIRVDEGLLDDFDEFVDEKGTDRSKEIRSFMRSTLNADPSDHGMRPPEDDEVLRKSYLALRKATANGELPVREAKAIISRVTNIPKESVSRRVIKPLERRGYLSRTGDPFQDPWLLVNGGGTDDD